MPSYHIEDIIEQMLKLSYLESIELLDFEYRRVENTYSKLDRSKDHNHYGIELYFELIRDLLFYLNSDGKRLPGFTKRQDFLVFAPLIQHLVNSGELGQHYLSNLTTERR